jgi:hypothetical protein
MTSADTETMRALQELLTERQQYEGWINALEAKRAITPAHVFERVHADYTQRLDRVMGQLSERTEQLRATLDEMSTRLVELQKKEAERIDARHEGELRAAVGEYSDDEWNRLRDDADLEIELVATERGEVETELAEMQRIVALTKGAQPETQQPTSESTAVPQDTGNRTESESVPTPSNAAVASPSSNTDETPSIENFVADWPVRHVDPKAQGDGVAEVPEVDDNPQNAVATAAPPTAPGAPPATPGPSSPSVEPRRDQEKTLKCPECGTMNYATEWYCERCGGELATF